MKRFLRKFAKGFVRLLFENVGWKLLALAVAVLLWMLVASEPELSTFANVRVEYKNLPDDLEISSEPVTTVTLELRGPSGELHDQGAGGTRPAVVLDMSGVSPGERSFPIGYGNVRLARGVHLVRSIPSVVRYDFERRVIRTVPVEPRFTGAGLNGYVVANWSVTPPQLSIEGPANRVARIHRVYTDAINVGSIYGPEEFHVNAFVQDPFVRFTTPAQVTVMVGMRKQ